MGLVLLIVIWLITLVSTYFFIAKTWWLPAGASALAPAIDHHFTTTYVVMGMVFVAAQLSLGPLVWMDRDRKDARRGECAPGNARLALIWAAPAVVWLRALIRRS